MPPRKRAPAADAGPRREKPAGKLARFAEAKKNNNDLLEACERLLLREAEQPQIQNDDERRQDVIHPSEMAKADWCPRSTYLRIKAAREGRLPENEAHRFQTENIFEEGHEYHRKWQARFRRMGRLHGLWKCEACSEKWFEVSPQDCPACGAGPAAITYLEVPLHDKEHMISGSADGEVWPALELDDDGETVLIEVKSIGEGTVRMELPRLLMEHEHEVPAPFNKTTKVLDLRGVWKGITKPFGPHLRQGFIYLRLRGQMAELYGLPDIKRICFIYEFKPTSMVKAFYVTRDDEAVQELWDSCADIVHALDKGGRPPRCIDQSKPCKACSVYEELESDHRPAASGRTAQGKPARRPRPGEAEPAAAGEASGRGARARGGSDRPRGRGADGPARGADAVGGLLGRAARRS